jgi:predicted DNA-binding protein (UPF0251 family)
MIAGPPGCALFKPAGTPALALEQVVLSLDELEALRLADLEGLYQEQAAERMGISRQTFGRTVETARKKVAEALVGGKALRIEGGIVEMADMRTFKCSDCGHTWQVAHGTARPAECPECKSANLHRDESERGPGGPGRGRHRHGCRRAGRTP